MPVSRPLFPSVFCSKGWFDIEYKCWLAIFFTSFPEKPTIFKHPVGTTAETGGYIAFSCDATGDPAPRFQWRKNGEIYQAGQGYKTNTLVLANVIMNDVGVYYCEAINSVGTAESRKATLKVVGRFFSEMFLSTVWFDCWSGNKIFFVRLLSPKLLAHFGSLQTSTCKTSSIFHAVLKVHRSEH